MAGEGKKGTNDVPSSSRRSAPVVSYRLSLPVPEVGFKIVRRS